MSLDVYQYALGALSGLLVGFSLGLFGGGGSILAVPLLIHLVGLVNPHQAIGTSAVAVAVNALAGIGGHARRGTIRWRCVAVYGSAGVLCAAVGAEIGKAIDGQRLLLLFAVLMFVVGLSMLRRRHHAGDAAATCTTANAPKVLTLGGLTGLCSGFFGIGGGFLIVPGLIASTGMPVINAIGSSLVVISAFGLTTAISYFFSGYVIWSLALAFICGGVAGAGIGCQFAHVLSRHGRILNTLFAGLVMVAAMSLLVKTWTSGNDNAGMIQSARTNPPEVQFSQFLFNGKFLSSPRRAIRDDHRIQN